MSILSNVILIVILCVLGLASRVFLTLAVYFDCQSKRIKASLLWTLLTAIFGWIPAVVYACVRSTSPKEAVLCRQCGSYVPPGEGFCPRCGNAFGLEMQKQKEKNSKTFLILFVVVYILTVILSGTLYFNVFREIAKGEDFLSEFFDDAQNDSARDFFAFDENDLKDWDEDHAEGIYYDLKGKAYDDIDDVVYYDADGNTYIFEEDRFCYMDDKKNTYASLQCFLDENGYFYFDKDNALQFDNQAKKYVDKDKKAYTPIMGVYWDAQGNMQSIY